MIDLMLLNFKGGIRGNIGNAGMGERVGCVAS